MKVRQFKKWLLKISFISALLIVASAFYATYELNHMFGAYTDVVNTTDFDETSKPTSITNVSILSPDGDRFIENQTVRIDKGIIISIDSINQSPSNHLIINGQGKYLIPGLIDAHVHLWQSPNDLLLYVANGVTHIREMMGSAEHLIWRKEIEEGIRLGPKMFVASNKVQSFGLFQGWFMNWTQGNINLNNPDNALSTLNNLSDEGYDAIKLGSFLDNENYKILGSKAEKIDLPIIGHLPLSVSLKELWNSNQKEVSHIEEFVKALNSEFGYYNSENAEEFLNFVSERSKEVARNLVKNRIAVVSTLGLTESFAEQKFNLDKLLENIQLQYVNPGIIEGTILTSRGLGWLPKVNLYRLPKNLSSEEELGIKVFWDTYAKAHQIMLKAMIDNGVQIMAGTDSNIPVMVPGYALHDELKSLTQSGMSPAQALRSATATPATRLEITSGSIRPKHRADFILLHKNPLENIENTKTIETVILNGKVLDRNRLDTILQAIKKANDKSRNSEITSFVD